ncbi:DUF6341 family protein [Robertkochia solimangrovi]|uniref:DUF6341 family protein n=1 Tax=Robertkochia solimangrovi TaxID=2213046 RepID=UPI00117C7B5D|nr:uracil phosphoribosyltransferase [Robertkochia solimangrovi]TRZ46015.1 uracil phosphoribosyltransferase [Robertkochia solimangrovi]
MSDFFYGIQHLFEDYLFQPMNALRFMDSWWAASTISWIFMAIGFAAFIYWMLQLKSFNDNNEERKDVSAHSYI